MTIFEKILIRACLESMLPTLNKEFEAQMAEAGFIVDVNVRIKDIDFAKVEANLEANKSKAKEADEKEGILDFGSLIIRAVFNKDGGEE